MVSHVVLICISPKVKDVDIFFMICGGLILEQKNLGEGDENSLMYFSCSDSQNDHFRGQILSCHSVC